jgi:hypothetical protein
MKEAAPIACRLFKDQSGKKGAACDQEVREEDEPIQKKAADRGR